MKLPPLVSSLLFLTAILGPAVFANSRNPYTIHFDSQRSSQIFEQVGEEFNFVDACNLFRKRQAEAVEIARDLLKKKSVDHWNAFSESVAGIAVGKTCSPYLSDIAALDAEESFPLNRTTSGNQVHLVIHSQIERKTVTRMKRPAEVFRVYVVSPEYLLQYFQRIAEFRSQFPHEEALDLQNESSETLEGLKKICDRALKYMTAPGWVAQPATLRLEAVWDLTVPSYAMAWLYPLRSQQIFARIFDEWQLSYMESHEQPTKNDLNRLILKIEEVSIFQPGSSEMIFLNAPNSRA